MTVFATFDNKAAANARAHALVRKMVAQEGFVAPHLLGIVRMMDTGLMLHNMGVADSKVAQTWLLVVTTFHFLRLR